MIGRVIGHYRVVSALGAGAMGEVYRAHDQKLGRDVALKVLPAGHLGDEGARSRFRREAKALSRLSHPHVAMLLDFDSAEGIDFLAMELVPGHTLAEELQVGPLPSKDVVRLGAQLARGLKAAHDQGVVHRDIKPSNLALTEDGLLKVLDFGIARLVAPETGPPRDDTTTHSAHGKVVGSPPYMSPEQVLGKEVDARTDLYSAGAVLYELLTGRKPFGSLRGGELSDAILHRAPERPSALVPSAPTGLEGVILKALEKDPALRHQTAGDLLADFDRLARDGTTGVADMAAAAEAQKRTRAGPAPVPGWHRAAFGTILLALLAGAWLLRPPPPPRIHSVRAVTERLSASPDPVWATDGARLYYSDRTNDVSRYWQVPLAGGEPSEIPFSHGYGAVVAYVRRETSLLMLGDPVEPQGDSPLYLLTVSTWASRRVGQLLARLAAVSPDERRLALVYGKGQRRLGLAGMDGSNLSPLLDLPVSTGSLAWAPDGRRLRFSAAGPKDHESETWIWETSVAGEPPRPLWPGMGGQWSGDGRHFLFQRAEGGSHRGEAHRVYAFAVRWDLYAVPESPRALWTRAEPVRLTSGPMSFWSPGSPDGRVVHAIGALHRGELVRLDPRTGRPERFAGGLSAFYAEPSPDGRWLAWVSQETGELWRSRPDGSERMRLTSADIFAHLPRWSPDGQSLVFVSLSPGDLGSSVARISAEGGPVEFLVKPALGEAYWDPCWSAEGDRVYFSSFVPGLRQVDVGSRRVSPVGGSEKLYFPKCSREGHVLATELGSAHFRVRWAGRTDWEPLDLGEDLAYPNWTRDGKAIVGLRLSPARVVRFTLATRKSETIAELGTTPLLAWVEVPWMGLAADDSPLVTLDRGTRGLYTFDWETP